MRPPLWTCRRCGRPFANRNQSHSCGRVPLAAHFKGRPPRIRALFDALFAAARAFGPVTLAPARTRIGLQSRMIFAAAVPLADALRGHLVLTRCVKHRTFFRVDSLGPRCFVHHFRLGTPADIDAGFRRHLAAACAVGRQEHLE
ncbi:MAG: hypothetical protein HYY18_11240 [Planctomycetes bacterium]|nr:hypothetical protein [Planctomycetota bacterium]